MGRGRRLPLTVCLSDGASATLPRWSARRLRRAMPKAECAVGVTTAAPSFCRPAGGPPDHEPAFFISTCTTRARRDSEGDTKVHAATGILQVGHWRWADASARRVSEPPGVAGSRHSDIAERMRRHGCPAQGSLPIARPWGPSPLFPARPNPAVHPLQPAIIRAELPLRGCPHHPFDRGSPARLRAPVERPSWPSFSVFSRGDEPSG